MMSGWDSRWHEMVHTDAFCLDSSLALVERLGSVARTQTLFAQPFSFV